MLHVLDLAGVQGARRESKVRELDMSTRVDKEVLRSRRSA